MLKSSFFLIASILFATVGYAQTPQWAINTFATGTGDNNGYVCKVAPNGNVIVGGRFYGSIDLDPSASTHMITSNGMSDMFLAAYTATGSFLWGFGIGGSDIDMILNLNFDPSNNVYIVGYFRGQNVDFDPSSANTEFLSDQGIIPSRDFGGDGFLAKYSATGAYQWAIDIGGESSLDDDDALDVDPQGNIYIGGVNEGTMDIDPSPTSTKLLDGANGLMYLIKYNTNGQLVWGFNFGQGAGSATSSLVTSLRVRNGFMYVCGFFQGSNIDFDPSTSNSALLSSTGLDDGFVAKFDTAGHYIFADDISGANSEKPLDIFLDASNSIYITGGTSSSQVNFALGQTTTMISAPGGGGNNDIFIAKYSNTGQYLWGSIVGGSGDDFGYKLSLHDTTLWVTGYFSDTVDFDPSSSVAQLVSAGNTDIFACRYSLNGHYLSGFRLGGTDKDLGGGIATDASGNLYISGLFTGSNIDFDPTTTTLSLSSATNMSDIYLAKYSYASSSSDNISVVAENKAKIYPNPVSNELVIEGAETGSEVEIYNVLGQELFKGTINTGKKVINTNDFGNGTYLLEITSKDGKREVRMLVK